MWNQSLGQELLNRYHPELPLEVRKAGNISFTDILRHMENHSDAHWDGPYHLKCHPCIINYDYIVKLETQDRDAQYIIDKKLRGRGYSTRLNAFGSTSDMLGNGKLLNIFKNLPNEQMKFLHKRLDVDLEMFGYTFDEYSAVGKCGNVEKCC